MIKLCGIYKITNSKGQIYIGASTNINARWNEHKRVGIKGRDRFDPENHKFEIIEECEKKQLSSREVYWIAFFDSYKTEHGLNLVRGGILPSENSIKKGIETKARNGKNVRSIETRKKDSENKMGDKNPMFGKPSSKRGIPLSEAQKLKLRLANLGKKHTEESKLKLKLAMIGKIRTAQHKINNGASRKGKPAPLRTCVHCGQQISFLLINRWHNDNCKSLKTKQIHKQ